MSNDITLADFLCFFEEKLNRELRVEEIVFIESVFNNKDIEKNDSPT